MNGLDVLEQLQVIIYFFFTNVLEIQKHFRDFFFYDLHKEICSCFMNKSHADAE